MKELELAKVVALKAYLLVNEAGTEGRADLRSKAERGVTFFRGRPRPFDLRRYIFYNLLLAECCRDSDPVPYRGAALEAGEQLEQLGYADPTREYMCIVDATGERKTTASFGDFKSSPDWSHSPYSDSPLVKSEALRASAAPAFAAVGLGVEMSREHAQFLYETSLEAIMRSHGIG